MCLLQQTGMNLQFIWQPKSFSAENAEEKIPRKSEQTL